uniref:Uncharacterized protein n=1 Tax=Cucumis sativus TaxID=3659 RepID=A0A0A0KAM2_CUCSA
MSSSYRIELLIDLGDSEEYNDSSYEDRISSSQIETGLREAIQTSYARRPRTSC